MGCQDRVVGLNNRGSDLRSRINTELQLAFLAIVDREAFHKQSTETRPSSSTKGVEDQETLQTGAVVGHTTDLVQDLVNQFLANCVVTAGVVVGRILLSSDHLLGMEQVPICTGSHFVDNIGLEIAVDGSRHVLALA